MSYRTLSALSEDEQVYTNATTNIENNNILTAEEIGKINESQIESKIKEDNIEFNVEDYEKTVSEGLYAYNVETDELKKVYGYIDYNLKVGDFITNSGYTVVLDSKGKVQQINDNTKEISKKEEIVMSQDLDKYRITNENSAYYINKAKENISNKNDILKEEIVYYYDVEENKKYACVTLETKDSVLGSKLESFSFEIQ